MSLYVDIEKSLGSFKLRVKLEAGDETLSLLGASGCGKSMTLKCIAGIVKPDRGRIEVDGIRLFDSEAGINLSPQQRHTGLMFQNYALFPNMTVMQNIMAGAKRETDRANRADKVSTFMKDFGISSLAGRYPHELSGGQQQRVALARILVSNPHILLLDEPFSALDSHLRFKLEQELRDVIKSYGKTVLLVSHDRDEVYRLSDRVAVMDTGHIQVTGSREQVFSSPKTRKAAVLTGCKNISAAKPLGSNKLLASDWGLELETDGSTEAVTAVGIRMHELRPGTGRNSFRFKVTGELENPFSYTIMLRAANSPDAAAVGIELSKEEWEKLRAPEISIEFPPEALLLLNK